MKKITKKILTGLAIAAASTVALTGCSTGAEVATQNIKQDADNFKIERRVVLINGITDKILLTIEGRCSVENEGKQLTVLCKTGDDQFKRHLLGLSDNVTYLAEQLESSKASEYHYKVLVKPETIIPNFEIRTEGAN